MKVEQLLGLFPVVVILGVRQCGKTTLAKMVGSDFKYFDLERGRDFEFFFKENPARIIIDEPQHSDQLFREIRSVVVRDRTVKGRFLLTGASSPFLLGRISESLAGRVGIVELGTLKMNERYGEALPPFYDILCDEKPAKQLLAFRALKPERSYDQVMEHLISGGYLRTETDEPQGLLKGYSFSVVGSKTRCSSRCQITIMRRRRDTFRL